MTVAKIASKKLKNRVMATKNDSDEIVGTPIINTKTQRGIEIEEPEIAIGSEEKTEVDPLIPDEDEELASEEAGLDEEEINPFGDKWEQ